MFPWPIPRKSLQNDCTENNSKILAITTDHRGQVYFCPYFNVELELWSQLFRQQMSKVDFFFLFSFLLGFCSWNFHIFIHLLEIKSKEKSHTNLPVTFRDESIWCQQQPGMIAAVNQFIKLVPESSWHSEQWLNFSLWQDISTHSLPATFAGSGGQIKLLLLDQVWDLWHILMAWQKARATWCVWHCYFNTRGWICTSQKRHGSVT